MHGNKKLKFRLTIRSELRWFSWCKSCTEECSVCEHFGGFFRSVRKRERRNDREVYMSTDRWNRWSLRLEGEKNERIRKDVKFGGKKNEGNNFCDESEKQRDIVYCFCLCRSNLGVHNFILRSLTSIWSIIRVTSRRLDCSRIVCFFWTFAGGDFIFFSRRIRWTASVFYCVSSHESIRCNFE